MTKIQPFINKYNWERITFLSKKDSWDKFEKKNETIALLGWYYLPVKKLSALLRGKESKHHGDFYCFYFLHSFATKDNIESHENLHEKKDFFNVIIPFEDTKMIEFSQYQKFHKSPFMIYAYLQRIILKIHQEQK